MREYIKKKETISWHEAQYNSADMNDKLIINLRDLSHTMRFLYEGRGSQKRILIVLDELGGTATQRSLTERLGIQPGSASEVIAKLENTGCIKRTPNETDRRTIDVTLTEMGKSLAAQAREQRACRHEQMFSCLSGDEKNQLLFLLEKVNTDWKEHYQDMRATHIQDKHRHHGQGHQKDVHHQRGDK